jgi:hypothetical protein
MEVDDQCDQSVFAPRSRREQWPQRTDIIHPFQAVDPIDQLFRLFSPKNRRHQVPGLRAHGLGAERIFLRSRWELREMIDLLSVCQHHFDDRAAWRGRIHQRLVCRQGDLCTLFQDFWIMHERCVVTVRERERSLDEGDRHQMLAIDIRHGAFANNAHGIGRKLDENAADMLGVRPYCLRKVNSASDGDWIG